MNDFITPSSEFEKERTEIAKYLSLKSLYNRDLNELNSFQRKMKMLLPDPNFFRYLTSTLSSSELQELKTLLIEIECLVEKKVVKEYLSGAEEYLTEKLNRCTPDILSEANELKISLDSHLLLVGSGAMPITAIIIHSEFANQITCLDSDPEAISLSESLIRKIYPSNQNFRFITQDINSYSAYAIYSHIIITGHIEDKESFLKKNQPFLRGKKILIRNSIGGYRLIFSSLNSFNGFTILNEIDHMGRMPYLSYIIEVDHH